MPSAFQLFGELKADTKQFEAAMHRAEKELNQTGKAIEKQEQKAKELGQTSATVARQYEKLTDKVKESRDKLQQTASAFEKGEASAKQMGSALQRTARDTSSLNSRLKDSGARLTDFGAKAKGFFSSFSGKVGLAAGLGGGLVGAVTQITQAFKRFAAEGLELNRNLDKSVRFLTTLDKAFQTSDNIKGFKADFQELSTQIPQTAENIADAAFTVKSAYSNLSRPELVVFLRELGIAATGSNTTINDHADNVIALAKAYNIAAKDMPKFSALIASVFGDALASDEKVGQGFNKILTSAKLLNQPLEQVGAAMAAVTSVSTDVATTVNNLKNVFDKLGDPQTTKGLKDVFNIDAFDAKGNFRDLSDIVNELHAEMAKNTPEEWATKLKKAIPDLQARTGFLELLRGIDTLNARLRDGSDVDAYGAKTKVMTEGAAADWEKFSNRVSAAQVKIGDALSTAFGSIAGQQDVSTGIEAFFNEIGATIFKALNRIGLGIELFEHDFAAIFRRMFGADAGTLANERQAIGDRYNNLYQEIEKQRVGKLSAIKQDQIEAWKDIFASPISSPEVKAAAQKNIESLGGTIVETAKTQGVASVKEAGDVLVKAYIASLDTFGRETARSKQIKLIDPQVVERAKQDGKDLGDNFTSHIASTINANQSQVSTAANNVIHPNTSAAKTSGQTIANEYTFSISNTIESKSGQVSRATESTFPKGGTNYGGFGALIAASFVSGIVGGIVRGSDRVGTAVSNLVNNAFKQGQLTQEAQSPSKRAFRELGVPFAEGMELGILSRIPNVADAASDFVHAAFIGADKAVKLALKGIKTGKKDKEGIELLHRLGEELSRVNVKTKEQETVLELFADKYDKLNSKIKEKILAAAKELDIIEKTKIGYEKVSDALGNLFEKVLPEKTELQKVADIFKDPANIAGINKFAASIGMTALELNNLFNILATKGIELDKLENLGTGRSGIDFTGAGIGVKIPEDLLDLTEKDAFPPPPIDPWNNFFDALRRKFKEFKDNAISTKEAIGEAFLDFTFGIGDAFAQAASEWDGTLKGFFSSILSALRQTVQQIISELIRVMITKAVLNIAGSLIGSLGGIFSGGFPGSGTTAHEGGHSGSFGAFTGGGSFSSFTGGGGSSFAGAFAGGGGGSSFAPAPTTNNVKNTYSLNMNVPPGTSQQQQQSIRQQGQQFLIMLKKLEQQNK